MAGESYTTPSGRTVTVPVYTDAADAPVAFKDFADSLGEGGSIDLDSEREGQLIQGDGADGWATGMALKVVQDLPADDDPNYAVGDAVFVLGDVDPKRCQPSFGGCGDSHETWNDTTYTVYVHGCRKRGFEMRLRSGLLTRTFFALSLTLLTLRI